jgi:hypothetical protein
MLVVVIVALLATGAAVIGSAHTLGNRYYDRQSQLDAVALVGLEMARARINGDKSVYPADGYATLEDGVSVQDGDGNTIEGLRRWLYVGPTGSISGQYGVFGSIVAVTRDAGGGVAVRRSQVFQESFAKYAYFTDIEPSSISFGGGDQIFGPVHTNDDIKIYASGATFHDDTKTHGIVQDPANGVFKKGYVEYAPRIDMPETAELTKLEAQATAGGMAFYPGAPTGVGQAYMRIEFLQVGDEGFFRVYTSSNEDWVSGDVPSGTDLRDSRNCGHAETWGTYVGQFRTAADHPSSTKSWSDSDDDAVTTNTPRCYLGGDPVLTGGFQPTTSSPFPSGSWVPWTGAIAPSVAGRPDAGYLFPLERAYNPSFKGVIYVEGNVLISGTLRGRVTLAATNQIIIGDDIQYANSPALGTCKDILGLFSGVDVVVADNLVNAPQRPWSGANYRSYDDTRDEFIDGIVLALDNFTVEDYADGSTVDEPCQGTQHGRGCLFLTGGIIQETRGAVGTVDSWGRGTGYVKRYAYDKCGATAPPPYFPTTGHFVKGQVYQVDPAGFSVADYFTMLTSS